MFRTLLALLAFAATLTAQDSRGTVLGRVSDSSGAAVPRATVQLINTATSTTLSATSNESGNYNIPFVIPGTYRLAVEAAGFNKHERPEVPVRINDVLNLDIELRVGNVTETVEVRAEVPLLEAANASTGQVIDQRRVQELPVQAGNAFELLLLTPGTVNSTNTRLRKASATNATSQVITAGAPQYYNEFTIDGIPNTFANGNQMRVAFAPPQSAVSEFKVSTTGYETYLGRTMGSIINVNTVSGTNQFHGEAHHWFANSALDAPNFFQNRSGQKKQVYQDNRFGASLGGPVWFPGYNGKGKTFFFYTHEQNKWGVPRTAIGSIPTEAQRGGDLSGLLARGAQYQIFDPLTTTQVSPGRFGRQPIAGNRIPASRINPISRNIARFWPEPNQPGTVEGRNNFSSGVKDIDSYYVHLARIDHTFSERHRVFFRMHYDWWSEDKQQFYGNETTGVYLNRINRGLAFDDVFVLNPSSVLNFRYGLTSQDFPEERRSAGFDLASLGFSPAYLRQLNPRATAFPFIGLGAVPSGSSLTGFTTNGSANMNGTYSGFSPWEAGDGTNTGIIHTFTGSVSTLIASAMASTTGSTAPSATVSPSTSLPHSHSRRNSPASSPTASTLPSARNWPPSCSASPTANSASPPPMPRRTNSSGSSSTTIGKSAANSPSTSASATSTRPPLPSASTAPPRASTLAPSIPFRHRRRRPTRAIRSPNSPLPRSASPAACAMSPAARPAASSGRAKGTTSCRASASPTRSPRSPSSAAAPACSLTPSAPTAASPTRTASRRSRRC
jgi:hypothetical protein